MTTPLPPITETPTGDLLDRIWYQTAPGTHTFCPSTCGPGHWSRGGSHCAECLDAELLRRGIDVANMPPAYRRLKSGRLVRTRWRFTRTG